MSVLSRWIWVLAILAVSCVDRVRVTASACLQTCATCCTLEGVCVESPGVLACGVGGNLCVACADSEVCSSSGACAPKSCDGCTNQLGCQRGDTVAACGPVGGACVACAAGASCVQGACVQPSCAGCRASNGACEQGTAEAACGSGGAQCVACKANERCESGSCALLTCASRNSPAADVDRWIAFDSNREGGNRDLYVIRPSGCGLKRLTFEPGVEREPAFSPDGKRLAFVSDRAQGVFQVFLLDLASAKVTQVTRGTEGVAEPAWAPDGSRLAFRRKAAVITVRPDGLDEQLILEGPDLSNAYAHPTYLPGGELVLDRLNQILVVSSSGSQRFILSPMPNTQWMPSVDPTGSNLAFATYCEPGIQSIWSVPTAGTAGDPCREGTRVSPPSFDNSSRPAWGPGFILYEGAVGAEILLISAGGGAPFNLTDHPGSDRNPAWAPAGTVIP